MTVTRRAGIVGPDSSAAGLLLRRPPGGMVAGSVMVAVLLAAASAAGLVGGAPIYEASPSTLVSPGGDAANLLVTVPALLTCVWAVHRGSLLGLLLWPGALFYALYISAIYLVAGPFTPAVFGHLGVIVVAGCVIVAVLSSIDVTAVHRLFAAAPARGIGGALTVIALLAYVGLFANPGAAAELGYRRQWAVDAGLGTPVLLVGGLLLWRRAPLGYVTAAPLLFVSGVGGLAFAVAAVLDQLLSGATTDPAVVGVHLAILMVDLTLLAVFVRHRSRPGTPPVGSRAGQRHPPATFDGEDTMNTRAHRAGPSTARAHPWSPARIPSQGGKVAVVTGANSGIGFATALGLAKAGADVVLACRNPADAAAAAARIRSEAAAAHVETQRLDLADLQSIRAAAAQLLTDHPRIDLLVNNAGVMGPPTRRTTADGYELQFGTNHLGHFALTGLLLPALLNSPGARVVTVTSMAHTTGRIRFDDLDASREYDPYDAYAQSKLANVLFAFELDRLADAAHRPLISVAVHPGLSPTNLQIAGPGLGHTPLRTPG